MSDGDVVLGTAPADPRRRELWLQHAAGYLIFEHVRGYALSRLDPGLDAPTHVVAARAIDHAVYGLMMLIDGIPPHFRNSELEVRLRFLIRLSRFDNRDELVAELDLFEGDGMCIGYHGWLEDDFGQDPVVRPASDQPPMSS